MKIALLALILVFSVNTYVSGETQIVDPVKNLDIKYSQETYKKVSAKSSAEDFIELTSEKEALEYFTEAELKLIKKSIDFKKQKLLVLAWKGSGADRINVDILESFPEQLVFSYKRGMTRDIKPHFKIFAVAKRITSIRF